MNMKTLITAAKRVAGNAYAPYSQFHVGAAIRTVTGKTYTGCNVENASYGLTCCAERNAIGQMVAHGEHEITNIVIYTPTTKATAPCGACRQVLYEFNPYTRILCVCDSEHQIDTTIEELLPHAFGPVNVE